MSVFFPPCDRCELMPDERWGRMSPCASCEEFQQFRQLGFDPLGRLDRSDVPGLLALAVARPLPPELHAIITRARALLQAELDSTGQLLKRLEEALAPAPPEETLEVE
jgi:hypothetical protein